MQAGVVLSGTLRRHCEAIALILLLLTPALLKAGLSRREQENLRHQEQIYEVLGC